MVNSIPGFSFFRLDCILEKWLILSQQLHVFIEAEILQNSHKKNYVCISTFNWKIPTAIKLINKLSQEFKGGTEKLILILSSV